MIGMTTAMVSMNAVVIHWAVEAPMANSDIRFGSATDMMVSLRITTKAAATSSEMTRLAPGGRLEDVGGRAAPAGVVWGFSVAGMVYGVPLLTSTWSQWAPGVQHSYSVPLFPPILRIR
ncbi:hypothetical protein GCM10010977_07760 [Citricoccus zhacaiensis]|uniref:Uncharacterized protein n=1 Tax=Citricoccus zhacaiensis TaxID=489142 RepID=A0ABQ2LU65_9MICC|nr:hypothetical protein GCM10010977_07760 [Citricoccus zhacaiensis]